MGGAPPQFLVLLWHHCIYYKRHPGIVIWTVLKPCLLLVILWLMLCLMASSEESKDRYEPAEYETSDDTLPTSTLTDGPLANLFAIGKTWKIQDVAGCDYVPHDDKFKILMDPNCPEPEGYRVRGGKLSHFAKHGDQMNLRINMKKCDFYGGHKYYDDYDHDYPPFANESNGTTYPPRPILAPAPFLRLEAKEAYPNDVCALLLQDILYFPNTSKSAVKIMQRAEAIIKDYIKFMDVVQKHQNDLNGTSELVNISVEGAIKKSTWIVGFPNFQSLQQHTWALTKHSKTPFLPQGVLGVVSFEDMNTAQSIGKQPYTILYDGRQKEMQYWGKKGYPEELLLQDIIERAIVEVTSGKNVSIGLAMRPTPTKCWAMKSKKQGSAMLYFLFFASVLAFLSTPATFMTQVLLEKELKLREYLYIMGVNSVTLKLSWIFFYALLLIPMSVIFMASCLIIVSYPPPPFFMFTDHSVLYMLLICYNISMLAFCYMLSNVFQTSRHSTPILYFIHMVVCVISCMQFQVNMSPGTLMLARFMSLHPVVPLYLGYQYAYDWETHLVGAKWSNILYSPVLYDEYGGVAEALGWMCGCTVFYMFMTWYLEKVFPGEFGQKQPFYFFLQPSYWLVSGVTNQAIDDPVNPEVEVVTNGTAGIVLNKLSKTYGGKKVALNQLSLTFYKSEITAFLGENGAGKSTAMNCLAGLINPTSGSASVHNFDVKTQMSEIYKILGFVPQYDILYPGFTVQEHLQFFGWLKGMSKKVIKEETTVLLTSMGMENMQQQRTTFLSGGQKRKLSIITGYLGNPHVIILDEPTSGVDPFSRRSIWDMVLKCKAESTTVVSTHFMDEADLLGDRVAIISEGQLKCAGTPTFLKRKYGSGFRLTIARNTNADQKAISDFVMEKLHDSKIIEEHGNDMTYDIPKELAHSEQLIATLKGIDECKMQLGISSYGLTEPTLDEVFLRNIKTPLTQEEQAYENGPTENSSVSIQYKNSSGCAYWLRIALALSHKRLMNMIYSPSVLFLQIIIPLLFIGLFAIGSGSSQSSSGHMKKHTVSIYDPSRWNVLFTTDYKRTDERFLQQAFKHGFPPVCPEYNCGSPEQLPKSMQEGGKQAKYDTCGGLSLKRFTNETKEWIKRQVEERNKRVGNYNDQPVKIEPEKKPNKEKGCLAHCLMHDFPNSFGELPSSDRVYRLSAEEDLRKWVIHINKSEEIVIGGFEFMESPDSVKQFKDIVSKLYNDTALSSILNKTHDSYVVLMYQPRLRKAMLNLWNTMLLRYYTKSAQYIELSIKEANLIDDTVFHNADENDSRGHPSIADDISTILQGFWLIFAFIFSNFGVFIAMRYESYSGLKRLQLLYGTNPVVYWITNFLFDMFQHCVTVAALVAILHTFEHFYSESLKAITIIAVVFVFQSIAFFYLLTTLFPRSRNLFNMIIAITLVICVVSFVMSGMNMTKTIRCNVPEECREKEKFRYEEPRGINESTVRYQQMPMPIHEDIDIDCKSMLKSLNKWDVVLTMIPAYQLSVGINSLTLLKQDQRVQDKSLLMECIYDQELLGKWFLKSLIWGIVCLLLTILLDCFDVTASDLYPSYCSSKKELPKKLVDSDVKAEQERVIIDQAAKDPLIVSNLVKVFKEMCMKPLVAVNDVTFGVRKSELFGLLGLNGAGKSTVFNMLTGTLSPTSGSGSIMGRKLFTKGWGRFRNLSYCPQENTLFTGLSVKDHFNLFAAIRGIPQNAVQELSNRLIHEVGLDDHKTKRAGQLSGGNQRKLQFALSLLDYRPVILMDEPTTGMDPMARRKAWNCIKRAIQHGCSVLLTSHSMEECEALCHRLVIMVAGQFTCIGSVQHLKHAFGNKYVVRIMLQAQTEASKVKEFISERIISASWQEEHARMLSFHVPCSESMKLWYIFKVMQECRGQFPLEDVTVSQTTLEQVFIRMAMADSATPIPEGPQQLTGGVQQNNPGKQPENRQVEPGPMPGMPVMGTAETDSAALKSSMPKRSLSPQLPAALDSPVCNKGEDAANTPKTSEHTRSSDDGNNIRPDL